MKHTLKRSYDRARHWLGVIGRGLTQLMLWLAIWTLGASLGIVVVSGMVFSAFASWTN
jgi:hypothetical protein